MHTPNSLSIQVYTIFRLILLRICNISLNLTILSMCQSTPPIQMPHVTPFSQKNYQKVVDVFHEIGLFPYIKTHSLIQKGNYYPAHDHMWSTLHIIIAHT